MSYRNMNSDYLIEMADNFSRQASIYAKFRPGYPQEMYDFLLDHVPQRQAAWDCGTGPGKVAAVLAQYFEEVYATDISDQQMSYAPPKENITYLNVPAEDSGLPEDYFDLIAVAQAMHWFDFGRFYSEVNRTARKGAMLAVIGYGMVRIEDRVNELIDRFNSYTFGKYFTRNRKYLDEHYRNIPFPFEEIAVPDFSISYQWSLDELEGYLNSWSTVQKFKDREGFNPVDDFLEKLKAVTDWGTEETKKVTFPVFMRLGRISK